MAEGSAARRPGKDAGKSMRMVPVRAAAHRRRSVTSAVAVVLLPAASVAPSSGSVSSPCSGPATISNVRWSRSVS